MKKTLKFGLLYFLSIILFALIYYAFWYIRPDHFITNQSINIHPIKEINSILWDDKLMTPSKIPISLLDLQKKQSTLSNKIMDLEQKSSYLKNEYSKLEVNGGNLELIRNKELSENIEDYRRRTLIPHEKKEAALTKNILELEVVLEKELNPIKRYPMIINLGKKRIALAEFRVEKAKVEYNIADYTLKNLREFMSKETIDKFELISNNRLENETLRLSYSVEVSQIRSRLYSLALEYRTNIIKQFNYIDFVYYSVGIATTTTFGDITANSKLIRFIVTIQLLISIFILGAFANCALSSKK